MTTTMLLCAIVVIWLGSPISGDVHFYYEGSGEPMWTVNDSGDVTTVFDSRFMTSGFQPYAFWAVDMGQDYEITHVFVVGWTELLNGENKAAFYVAVSSVKPTEVVDFVQMTCYPFKQCSGNMDLVGDELNRQCSPSIVGRYLYVYITWTWMITIADVDVNATVVEHPGNDAGVPPDAIIGDFAYFPNQKGIGGKRHLIKGNLTECKTACVNNDDCTALDWRSCPDDRCWLYLSPVRGMKPHKHMDHYMRAPCQLPPF